MNLADRYGPWALITGASEGTGSAFARQLAGAGINCVLVARRTAPLEALRNELSRDFGIEVSVLSIDLALPGAAAQIAAAVDGKEIGIAILNAGADPNGSRFLDQILTEWVALAYRNTITAIELCHIFGGPMRARGRGGIILVGSGAGYGGAGHMAVYAGTKAFDLCFAEGLWAELKPHGVDVLSLMMGRTDTPAHRENLARRGQDIPAGMARSEDVARDGLARLPFGPVHNMGLADDVGSPMQPSAASRRTRVEVLEGMAAKTFGSKA